MSAANGAVAALRSVEEFRREAERALSGELYERMFGAGGNGVERTDAANRAALEAVAFRPRVLNDVGAPRLATTVLGQQIELPLLLAPIGDAARVTAEAELATVGAAGAAGVATVLGLASTNSVDEVIAAARGPVWFQLYVLKDRGMTRELVEHAAAVGCGALVVTVDNPGVITADLAGVSPSGEQAWGTLAKLGMAEKLDARGLMLENVDPTLTWEDLEWLRGISPLPLVLKGVQTAEDAELCQRHGVDAIVVSNHGGHAIPDPLGALPRLPEVVAAAPELEVYFDGGVREGADVLKALALGARAVLLGRAQYWGLAAGGEAGLRRVLEILADELTAAMKFCGLDDVARADRPLVT